jgi:hypothetical protein
VDTAIRFGHSAANSELASLSIINIGEVADIVALSKSHFSRAFNSPLVPLR